MRFQIISADPFQYKDWIVAMWDEFLPGTSPKRLEWMSTGNPAGSALWYFALETATGELAGTISVMPKELFFDGKKSRGGIIGDFMILPKYRTFGPALSLLKTTIADAQKMGFQFLYTVPNHASMKMAERAGLSFVAKEVRLVRPMAVEIGFFKSNKSLGKQQRAVILVWPFLYAFCRDSYVFPRSDAFEEVYDFDERFDDLWEQKLKTATSGISGDRSSGYLKWRYAKNPEHSLRIMTYNDKRNKSLLGYAIFYISENKLCLYDLFSLDEYACLSLIKRMAKMARKEARRGLDVSILERNPLIDVLASCGLFRRPDGAKLLVWPDGELFAGDWFFLSCDRNL